MLWRNQGWSRLATKTAKTMVYYAKIQAALRAGYLIVPNFNVDLVAVRTARSAPPAATHEHARIAAEPQLLPPGQGRYVQPFALTRDDSYTETTPQGKKRVDLFTAVGYDDLVDFPVTLAQPAIVNATDRALATRIFDRVGIVRRGRRSDPIVVGQVVDPRVRYWHHNPRCVTFFVAWWLDARDL
jgi:hypothetical protein